MIGFQGLFALRDNEKTRKRYIWNNIIWDSARLAKCGRLAPPSVAASLPPWARLLLAQEHPDDLLALDALDLGEHRLDLCLVLAHLP